MISFTHDTKSNISTLSELLRVYGAVSPDKFFGCYAYATQSGFRSFELAVGAKFWSSTSTRWLFGIDYGRTDPRALREIAGRENAAVRIFDGTWVVAQEGFSPRRDFHAKLAIMQNSKAEKSGMVLGSGNFSYNGLRRSVEAGATFIAETKHQFKELVSPVMSPFEELWNSATPLADVLDKYETLKSKAAHESDLKRPKGHKVGDGKFWIEAGYVTKNRGPDKPGNQIFFPNGFRQFFGFKIKSSVKKSDIIGSVTFSTDIGDSVTNNLRLNHNGMEKISLPMPETHGFGVYDGKVLVFERSGSEFVMNAYETIEFETLFGSRLVDVMKMSGGRRYGAII